MYSKDNNKMFVNAKRLRKEMTSQERKLWYLYLRNCKTKFYKQKIFGNYILDFYAHSVNLCIEIDGGQHYSPEEYEYDLLRTKYLNDKGIEVLRFTNTDIEKRFRYVCEMIDRKCQCGPSQSSSLRSDASSPRGGAK